MKIAEFFNFIHNQWSIPETNIKLLFFFFFQFCSLVLAFTAPKLCFIMKENDLSLLHACLF